LYEYVDISLNNILIPIALIIITISFTNLLFKGEYSVAPTNSQKNMELLIESVHNLIKQQIGEEGYILSPLICTLFNPIL
jgi:F0F1-type ATP synthase membrane subunit a